MALRQSFSSHRSLFARSDIDYLRGLTGISNHLRLFIEMKEEFVNVDSLEEYVDLVSRLTHIKDALADFPVSKRIAKEIRGLNDRLPAIRDQDEVRRKFRLNTRTLDLEQHPHRCRRHHPMMIRKSRQGYFWGCSRYPFCTETAQLTSEEQAGLPSD